MDAGLLAWGRAVKQRQRRPDGLPVLWLFTDAGRLADPLPAISRLPPGFGVVFRHDGIPQRAALARRVAGICKARRLTLVVAGDARLAAGLGAGVHLRAGRWPGRTRCQGLVTSSAHDLPEALRAQRAGARIVFLSPAFATPSHAEKPGLGALKWLTMARRLTGAKPYALGGVNGENVLLLAGFCAGVGAITALIP